MPLTPRQKTNAGFGLAMLAFAVIGTASYVFFDRLVGVSVAVRRLEDVNDVLAELTGRIAEAEARSRAYVLTGDRRQVTVYRSVVRRLPGALRRLEDVVADDPSRASLTRQLGPLLQRRIAHFALTLPARDRGAPGPEIARLVSEGVALTDSVQSVSRLLAVSRERQLGAKMAESEIHYGWAPVVILLATLAGLLIVALAMVAVNRDLAAREKSSAALQEAEERHRAVLEGLGEGVFVQEASGRITEANAAAQRILGVTGDELVGRHVTEVPWQTLREDGSPLPPEERPASVSLRTGEPVRNAVIGALRPDGRLAWLLVNVRPMTYAADGSLTAVVSSFADISRRKEAEQAVRENQARLQDFLDAAHDLIVTAGPDGRLQYVNRAWEGALGVRAVDALGRSLFDFLEAACHDRFHEAFRRMLAGETVEDLEATFVGPGGRRVTVLGSSNCRFEDDRPVAIRSVFRDVSEIKRTQEALVRARDEAEDANRAKSAFLANMSHELRTPLNSVIGFAGVLLKNRAGNLRAEDTDFLGRIHENGKHLLGLINSILDLSKVEAGKFELEVGPVDLRRLVDEALGLVAGQAKPGVRVAADVPATVRPLSADAGKLKQVVVNLLGNALKFTEQGSVTVRVAVDAVTGEAEYLEVCDTGIGIPADRQAAIFEAFQQADTGTARRFGGTGLGLTISRTLAQLMGFRLEVESAEGAGSAFRVVFGAARAQPGPAAPAPAAPAAESVEADLRDALVLVIEDDEEARQLLARQIAELGPRTIEAASGGEGLRLARAERPDVVTVDLLMPGLTGWDVIRTLRADPGLRDIPAVVVSSVARERGATVPGAADLLNKPVDREELLTVLRRHLRGAAQRRAARDR